MLRIAKGMCDRGRNVDLVLVKAQGEFLGEIPYAVRLIDLNSPSVASAIPSMVRYLRKEAPAAILTALTHMNVAVVMARWFARSKARLVLSERNQISLKAAAVQHGGRSLVYASVRFAYPLADGVTAVSRGVANDLLEFTGVKPQNVQVIYNPAFGDDLIERSREPLDHPWFAEDQPPVILAVGRLHHQKGFDILLDAFSAVLAEKPSRLIILGEGHEREPLERQAQALGIAASRSISRLCEKSICLYGPRSCVCLEFAMGRTSGCVDRGHGVRMRRYRNRLSKWAGGNHRGWRCKARSYRLRTPRRSRP